MPTTYAHYTFGTTVFENLNDDLKKLISNHKDLFNIGLHGPDILFYYKALGTNAVNKKGNEIHSEKAAVFFEKSRYIIQNCSCKDEACAYIMGFICHFMLDSECHPFIRQREDLGFSHGEIEAEFDRELMIKNKLNPVSYKPTGHIVPSRRYADCISMFYEDISDLDILKALKSMKFYLNFMVAPGYFKRALIFTGLKATGNYEKMSNLIMSYEPNPDCAEISGKLMDLFMKAVAPTVDLIHEYYKGVENNEPLNSRFDENFD